MIIIHLQILQQYILVILNVNKSLKLDLFLFISNYETHGLSFYNIPPVNCFLFYGDNDFPSTAPDYVLFYGCKKGA